MKTTEIVRYQFVISVLLFALMCASTDGLICPPCDKIHCRPRKPSKLTCKGGVTTGVCNCCPMCARVLGERCGGDNNYLGKCDKGLYCEPIVSPRVEYRHKRREPIGICTKVPVHVRDQPAKERQSCRPNCSPEFCKEHPRAICSAQAVADVLQKCQGKCQHTSCRACRFVSPPSCRKCAEDDFRCMKRFGKCVKKDTCSQRKFPCSQKYSKKHERGKFQCFVPECVES